MDGRQKIYELAKAIDAKAKEKPKTTGPLAVDFGPVLDRMDALERAIHDLVETISGINPQVVVNPGPVNVAPSPVTMPEASRPRRMRFNIQRDMNGRITSVDAEETDG